MQIRAPWPACCLVVIGWFTGDLYSTLIECMNSKLLTTREKLGYGIKLSTLAESGNKSTVLYELSIHWLFWLQADMTTCETGKCWLTHTQTHIVPIIGGQCKQWKDCPYSQVSFILCTVVPAQAVKADVHLALFHVWAESLRMRANVHPLHCMYT